MAVFCTLHDRKPQASTLTTPSLDLHNLHNYKHHTCPQYESTSQWPLGRPLSSSVVPWETTERWRLRVAARWPPGRPLRSPVAPREATGRRHAWQCCSLLGGPLGGHRGPRWSLGRPLGGDGIDPRTSKDFHNHRMDFNIQGLCQQPFGLIVCCTTVKKNGVQVQVYHHHLQRVGTHMQVNGAPYSCVP